MLKIEDLHVRTGDAEILHGLSLEVNAGEVHAIMGPNGSGKSTLAQAVAGHEDYEVTAGRIEFEGEDIADLDPEERARAGIFLGFQYPVETPGVSMLQFLRESLNAQRRERGEDELSGADFIKRARAQADGNTGRRRCGALFSENPGRGTFVEILQGERLVRGLEVMKPETHDQSCQDQPIKARHQAG